jgi:hypothetical protein
MGYCILSKYCYAPWHVDQNPSNWQHYKIRTWENRWKSYGNNIGRLRTSYIIQHLWASALEFDWSSSNVTHSQLARFRAVKFLTRHLALVKRGGQQMLSECWRCFHPFCIGQGISRMIISDSLPRQNMDAVKEFWGLATVQMKGTIGKPNDVKQTLWFCLWDPLTHWPTAVDVISQSRNPLMLAQFLCIPCSVLFIFQWFQQQMVNLIRFQLDCKFMIYVRTDFVATLMLQRLEYLQNNGNPALVTCWVSAAQGSGPRPAKPGRIL